MYKNIHVSLCAACGIAKKCPVFWKQKLPPAFCKVVSVARDIDNALTNVRPPREVRKICKPVGGLTLRRSAQADVNTQCRLLL